MSAASPELAATVPGSQASSRSQQLDRSAMGAPGQCLLSYLDQLCLQEYCCMVFELPPCLRARLMDMAVRDLSACIFLV